MAIKSSKMSSTASTVGRDVEAREYLEQHRVLELFNNMTSQLIYNRPGKYILCGWEKERWRFMIKQEIFNSCHCKNFRKPKEVYDWFTGETAEIPSH